MTSLLVVEDDETIGAALSTSLQAHGYQVDWQRGGRTAVQQAEARDFDLVILDLGLPDLDGVEVCRRLRRALPGTVIVMLTARSEEMDVVVGLEAGADDYLTKPIGLAELHARLRAHLRRDVSTQPATPVATIGDLVVDTARRRVTVRDQEVALRAREFDLLARLAAEPEIAIPRDVLMTDVWDVHWVGPTKTLDVHVAALRRKLAAFGDARLPRIRTLRGHGYRLEMLEEPR